MKDKNINKEYEQYALDFGEDTTRDEFEESPEPKKKKSKTKELEVGAAITVSSEAKRFCDGRGIPDFARKAFIKHINHATKTVLIETEPNGKELGVLFISDVVLA